jgi:hypothetical protein
MADKPSRLKRHGVAVCLKLLECCSPRRISDFLFVAPAVGVSFEVMMKGSADPRTKLHRYLLLITAQRQIERALLPIFIKTLFPVLFKVSKTGHAHCPVEIRPVPAAVGIGDNFADVAGTDAPRCGQSVSTTLH